MIEQAKKLGFKRWSSLFLILIIERAKSLGYGISPLDQLLDKAGDEVFTSLMHSLLIIAVYIGNRGCVTSTIYVKVFHDYGTALQVSVVCGTVEKPTLVLSYPHQLKYVQKSLLLQIETTYGSHSTKEHCWSHFATTGIQRSQRPTGRYLWSSCRGYPVVVP